MIYETLSLGVEVVDVYHSFVRNKQEGLFSYYHQISPRGAALVGKEIAEYLKKPQNSKQKARFGKKRK